MGCKKDLSPMVSALKKLGLPLRASRYSSAFKTTPATRFALTCLQSLATKLKFSKRRKLAYRPFRSGFRKSSRTQLVPMSEVAKETSGSIRFAKKRSKSWLISRMISYRRVKPKLWNLFKCKTTRSRSRSKGRSIGSQRTRDGGITMCQ
jgi:hypothetical protein